MKILLATYWAIPHVGGVWNYIVQLRKRLEALGHEVDILGYDEENKSVYILNENRKIDSDKLLPLLNAKLDAQTYPALHANELVKFTEFQRYVYELSAAYLGLDKYDVIHTQDVISTTSINRVKPKNIPLVASLHGSVAQEVRHQLTTTHKSNTSFMARVYFDELERLGATSADVTIVANKWLREILMNEFQVPNEKIQVLHYGFDSEDFIKQSKINSAIVRPKDKKVIIYSGRLVELKGVQHLISALGELKKIRGDWVCWIVGNGDHQAELKTQSKVNGLDKDILFFGKRDDIPYLLANSDIFVLPSLLENQSLSVIEAQILGKAIIVTDAGGLPEMVEDGVTGLIIPTGDSKALCKKLNLLLKDGIYRQKLGGNAKKWGMTYWSIDDNVKKLINVYHSAISKHGKVEGNVLSNNN
ncbi:glycosyltransferase family 4 protein [Bacillus sp. FDAARGOS_1420]|uniref:glycosyltransferase family 4 protein n=1 Tax=unclassified Bacillus (in: firmicutes) TaxID=185979 RepID=UPI001C5B0B93|nr:glycosyltransferase family 4 protein [Bacillus sp. FDAARGOS_1420]MBW3496779.1 glycosyltransferase family 4 protein [Bacillus sp. FDAARGOS_1420]